MDLVPIIVAGATGGAAGALVKEVATKGADWLIALVASHSPEVKAQVEANARRFLERLARRVEMLEAELPSAREEIFPQALRHPGFSLLLQKAFTSAATTDVDERHEILSELIVQRLTAGADDLEALAGAAACDVVLALSSMHIRLLGVAVASLHLVPLTVQDGSTSSESPESAEDWWDQNLGPLCTPDLRRVSPMDFRHLAGLACVSVNVVRNDLLKVFDRPQFSASVNPVLPQMEQYPWWQVFMHVWVAGLQNVTLTSVGTLIGIMYRDRTLNRRTDIRWEEKRPPSIT